MNTLAPLINPIEDIDHLLQHWSQIHGGEERQYPVLMDDATLRRAGYHEAFPHLLLTAAAQDPSDTAARPTLQSSGWCLSPAVCYHVYAALQSQTVAEGIRIGARGHCFRNEEVSELIPGRRQVEFQMRELVLVGSPEWIQAELEGVTEEIAQLATEYNLPGSWESASDPFFLPRAQGKAHLQKLLGTKLEYCLPDGLAIASINRHRSFFGERFAITLPDGSPAHSACIAFGLDRWASQGNA